MNIAPQLGTVSSRARSLGFDGVNNLQLVRSPTQAYLGTTTPKYHYFLNTDNNNITTHSRSKHDLTCCCLHHHRLLCAEGHVLLEMVLLVVVMQKCILIPHSCFAILKHLLQSPMVIQKDHYRHHVFLTRPTEVVVCHVTMMRPSCLVEIRSFLWRIRKLKCLSLSSCKTAPLCVFTLNKLMSACKLNFLKRQKLTLASTFLEYLVKLSRVSNSTLTPQKKNSCTAKKFIGSLFSH